LQNAVGHGVRVPEQHPQIAMPAYQRYFRNAQALLEEATYGFVAQVVKVQIVDPCPPLNPLPRQSEGVRGDGK